MMPQATQANAVCNDRKHLQKQREILLLTEHPEQTFIRNVPGVQRRGGEKLSEEATVVKVCAAEKATLIQ